MQGPFRFRLPQALLLATALAFAGTACAQSTAPSPDAGLDTPGVNAPPAGAMAFDLLIVRPLSLVATVAGTALFIINLPLSVVEKDAPAQPFQQLVVRPLNYTFRRPLGQMD